MTNVLYIGNYLNGKRSNVSTIHVLGALLEAEGYRVYYSSHKTNKVLRLWAMLYSCVKYRHRVEMVLIDTYSTQNFYYALLCSQLCRILGLPYICNLNGGNLPYRLQQYPQFSDMLFTHAKYNVAPSLYLKQEFEAYGFTNVVYIPNTLEIQKYPFTTRAFDAPKLLWVRSFAKLYHPKQAVQVLKALQDKGYAAELCMVGPDSDGSLAEVQQLAKALQVEVRFTGKLSKTEWVERSKAYNVFINTTNFDNTPVSVIEAMALGLPIVSTNVGGMPYLVKHLKHGLLVPPNDSTAMVDAITTLFESPELRASLISHARQRVEHFDWQSVKALWDDVIHQKFVTG